MAISISKALNIENKERGVVYLLLLQSIFLGIFAGALDVGANSLFLEAYSANLMPRAFMISGAVGILFTSIYTYLQKRIPFKLFTILNLLIVIILTGVLRIGYSMFDDPRLAFALLVMMGPLIIISMLGFWGTAGRYFTLREGKRLFGIIDTGSIVGMILAFYAVPVLVRLRFNVYDTLLIGFVSLVIALIFQLVVLRKHTFLTTTSIVRAKRDKNSGFFSIFRNRYTSMMALFVILSVITAFFVHYSFMWATEANYPDSRELTSFIGAFFGTMMIFTVVIKSTLYGWLMKNYGLKVTLLISPALLLILTVIASAVGGLFGYGPESASFTFFFLVIALSKLFNKSLKDAIESPSMKILYQSLDSDKRFDVQARIDGVVNELTAFSAGLIMAGLLFLSFITVIHFSYILVALLIVWVILGLALYNSYRKTLNDSLAEARSSTVIHENERDERLPDLSIIPMYRDLMQVNPLFYHTVDIGEINKLLSNHDPERQLVFWKFISDTLHYCDHDFADRILEQSNDGELNAVIGNYKKRLHLPGKKIEESFRSSDKERILAALIQTVNNNDTGRVSNIITLLRDRDIQLRAAAIEAAGKLKVKELGSYLVDYLGHPQLYAVTWSALVNMGELILENLENTFHKNGIEISVQLRIVRAMVAIGGEKANEYLFHKISYHQRNIREAAIFGLYRSNFTPSERAVPILHTAIYQAALAGAVNIATEFVVRENNPENGLLEAVIEERTNNDKILFALLGITYDKSAIEHVQRSIEDTENEDTGFALELLNLLVDDQVFAYLEPYYDVISVGEKIRKLQDEMPVEILSYENLLPDLLNRDSLYAGNYLRICAIEAIRKADNLDASRYLAAQVFHPNMAISKSALHALSEKNELLHQDIIYRIEAQRDVNSLGNYLVSGLSGDRVIQIVEDLKLWKSLSSLSRETLLRLVYHFEGGDTINHENVELVSFVRSRSAGQAHLNDGVVINLSNYPAMVEQIKYLAAQDNLTIYQIKRVTLRELLFDITEVLPVLNKIFSDSGTEKLNNIKA